MSEYGTGKGIDFWTLMKIIAGVLIFAGIVSLVGSLIINSGGADVSSGDESADVPAGDSGSSGAIAPTDSDSSDEFKPTAEMTLSTGVTVSAGGLEIAGEGWVDSKNMVPGTMYVYSGYILGRPATITNTVIKKKKMDDISFSMDGVSIGNIRPKNTRGTISIFADIQIPEWKKVSTQITGLSSKNELRFSTSGLNLITDSLVDGSSPIGTNIPEDNWKDTELIIIRFSVQNK